MKEKTTQDKKSYINENMTKKNQLKGEKSREHPKYVRPTNFNFN